MLGIGVQGGFKADDEFDFEDVFEYSIVLLPTGQRFAYPDRNLPMLVRYLSPTTLPTLPSALRSSNLPMPLLPPILSPKRRRSRPGSPLTMSRNLLLLARFFKSRFAFWQLSNFYLHSNLTQNGRKLPSSGWTCDVCGGDATTNLWLNLSSGAVLCGRKNYDGTGGRGHALEHYQKHNYPLAVKLGTITGEGQADVWSYVDDNLVIDPLLDQHLAHWGLNIKELKKVRVLVH